MDAPNTPNPAIPNAKDQFHGCSARSHKSGSRPSSPKSGSRPCSPKSGSRSCSSWSKCAPVQPLQQPAPAQPSPVGPTVPAQPAPVQPVPVGLVAPVPQVFYQNWIRKKPEFSGKPEEDVESHLLSARDWKEAHNFPNEVKVRHFCLTLIGEARLWYESLAPLDDDWPALQNKF